jgi:hypothetical protein
MAVFFIFPWVNSPTLWGGVDWLCSVITGFLRFNMRIPATAGRGTVATEVPFQGISDIVSSAHTLTLFETQKFNMPVPPKLAQKRRADSATPPYYFTRIGGDLFFYDFAIILASRRDFCGLNANHPEPPSPHTILEPQARIIFNALYVSLLIQRIEIRCYNIGRCYGTH